MSFFIDNENSEQNDCHCYQSINLDQNCKYISNLEEKNDYDINNLNYNNNFIQISKNTKNSSSLFSTDINFVIKDLINDRKQINISDDTSENPFTQLTFYKSNNEENQDEEIHEKKEKKKSGRKRNKDIDGNEHNKFSEDNLRRKCKHLVLKNVLTYINKRIKHLYNGNIGKGLLKKELSLLNQSQIANATIKYNKDFLNKTLANIFSDNISKRYTNLPENHNKLLIERLINEEDEKKRKYFVKLFNLNFIQCLKHFIGKDYFSELDGLKNFKETKNEIIKKYPEDGEDYYRFLEYYIYNFEDLLYKKKNMNEMKKK